MRRRAAVPAVAVATFAVLAAAAGGAGANGAPATAHSRPAPVFAHPHGLSIPGSYALMGAGHDDAQFVAPVNGGAMDTGEPQAVPAASEVADTALNATGTTALIAEQIPDLYTLVDLRGVGKPGPAIHLAQFNGEGAADFGAFSEGVAVTNHAALVAVDEKGVVQLRETPTSFRIDKRVSSPGSSEAHTPHAPGFIRFGGAADLYEGVTVSQVPLSNGKFLGVAIDRNNDSLAVIEGVGTATPEVVAILHSSDLAVSANANGQADGGMAFSPATATRAVLTTPGGIDVLNLSHPAHPVLQAATSIGAANSTMSVTVSPDGDTVVASNLDTLYTLRGLLSNGADSLTPVGNFMPSGGSHISRALGFTTNNRLLVEYDILDASTSTDIEQFGSFDGVTATGQPTSQQSITINGFPDTLNSMSVFPVPNPRLHPLSLGRHLRVGKRMHVALSVLGGVGRYGFRVTSGSLPAGLHLRGHAIAGRPKHAGRRHVTITAVNQYGGAVLGRRLLRVHR